MAKADGDARPIGQLRTEIMADLILRPWDTSRPPVTAHVTVLAPLPVLRAGQGRAAAGSGGGEEGGSGQGGSGQGGSGQGGFTVPTAEDAATVDGAPITAGQLRDLLEQLDALCPGGLQAPTGGSLSVDLIDPVTGALRATVTRRELEQLARRGCREHPTADCGCAVLDKPPPVDRYEPTPAQHRFVRARDRTCRQPGCRRPARWTDADHVHPHAEGGETACTNLCALCRRHHRLKTHAPGLAVHHDRRRGPLGDHPERGHPHHPTTGLATTTAPAAGHRQRPTRPRRRSATVLTSPRHVDEPTCRQEDSWTRRLGDTSTWRLGGQGDLGDTSTRRHIDSGTHRHGAPAGTR